MVRLNKMAFDGLPLEEVHAALKKEEAVLQAWAHTEFVNKLPIAHCNVGIISAIYLDCLQAAEKGIKDADIIVQSHERRLELKLFKYEVIQNQAECFWLSIPCLYQGVKAAKRKLEEKGNPKKTAKAKARNSKLKPGIRTEEAVKAEDDLDDDEPMDENEDLDGEYYDETDL